MDPNDIEAREFTIAHRGYDREEVDAFLRVLGAEVRRLQTALKKTGDSSPGAAAGEDTAGGAAAGEPGSEPGAVSGAGPEAAEAAGDAPPRAPAETYRKVGDETARILVAAEQAATEIKERGKREAAELAAAARHEAAALAKAAKAERGGLEEDIRQLHEARSLLGTEMEDMRRRFEELVLRLRQPFDVRHPRPKFLEAKRPHAPAAPAPAASASAPARSISPAEHFFRSSPPPMVPVPAAPAGAPAAEDGEEGRGGPEVEESVVMVRAGASVDVKGGGPPPFTSVNGNGASHAPEPEADAPPGTAAPAELPPPPGDAEGALDWRSCVLGKMPDAAAARLKRLLQEDQSDLLERLRAGRGVGPAANYVLPTDQHAARFAEGLSDVLAAAFQAGRGAGGSPDSGDAAPVIETLVIKQLVTPLRRDLLRLIEPPTGRDASATATSKRASDVYRVWKGVRTNLLGEGLVYAVFHQGLLDAVRGNGSATKEWVISDESNCPREVCRSNASAGPVDPDAPFPSGHLVPPAHGGCTCTLLLVRG